MRSYLIALLVLPLLVGCDPGPSGIQGSVAPDPNGQDFPGVVVLDSNGRRVERVQCEGSTGDFWECLSPGDYRVVTKGRRVYEVRISQNQMVDLTP